MARAIFLDFDGVLHDADRVEIDRWSEDTPVPCAVDGQPLFDFAPLLAEVLRPYPDVLVVVHSSWGRYFDVAACRALLAPSGLRVDGIAAGRYRPDRIAQYAHDHGIADWIALDDEPQHFDERWCSRWGNRLIACHPNRGLSNQATLDRVREWLAANSVACGGHSNAAPEL
jgi:hypothetical protein